MESWSLPTTSTALRSASCKLDRGVTPNREIRGPGLGSGALRYRAAPPVVLTGETPATRYSLRLATVPTVPPNDRPPLCRS